MLAWAARMSSSSEGCVPAPCAAWAIAPMRPSKRLPMKPAQRLAMFTYLPTRSLFTRAQKSVRLRSMSSIVALSLAA